MTASKESVRRFLAHKFLQSDTDPLDPEDFIHSYGFASHIIMYSAVFMPELIEIEGSVVLKSGHEDTATQQKFREHVLSDIREEVEESYNILDVPYILGTREGRDTTNEEDDLLAELIRDAWDGWLKVCYPDRTFKVVVIPAEENGGDVAVTFHEVR